MSAVTTFVLRQAFLLPENGVVAGIGYAAEWMCGWDSRGCSVGMDCECLVGQHCSYHNNMFNDQQCDNIKFGVDHLNCKPRLVDHV